MLGKMRRMGSPADAVLYVLAVMTVVVGVDLLFFREKTWFGSGLQPTSASSSCSVCSRQVARQFLSGDAGRLRELRRNQDVAATAASMTS